MDRGRGRFDVELSLLLHRSVILSYLDFLVRGFNGSATHSLGFCLHC